MTNLEIFIQKYGAECTPTMDKKLEDFNPKTEYGNCPESLSLSDTQHRVLVGKISLLIRDMCNVSSEEELIRAIKYSMVAIDAKKHGLDYKKAESDLGIQELYKKYHKPQND